MSTLEMDDMLRSIMDRICEAGSMEPVCLEEIFLGLTHPRLLRYSATCEGMEYIKYVPPAKKARCSAGAASSPSAKQKSLA